MSNSIIFIFSQYKYCGIRYKNLPPHSPFPPGCLTAGFMHYLLIRVQREMTAVRPALLSELLFNPQKLVIFRHTIGTARRSGFNPVSYTHLIILAPPIVKQLYHTIFFPERQPFVWNIYFVVKAGTGVIPNCLSQFSKRRSYYGKQVLPLKLSLQE